MFVEGGRRAIVSFLVAILLPVFGLVHFEARWSAAASFTVSGYVEAGDGYDLSHLIFLATYALEDGGVGYIFQGLDDVEAGARRDFSFTPAGFAVDHFVGYTILGSPAPGRVTVGVSPQVATTLIGQWFDDCYGSVPGEGGVATWVEGADAANLLSFFLSHSSGAFPLGNDFGSAIELVNFCIGTMGGSAFAEARAVPLPPIILFAISSLAAAFLVRRSLGTGVH